MFLIPQILSAHHRILQNLRYIYETKHEEFKLDLKLVLANPYWKTIYILISNLKTSLEVMFSTWTENKNNLGTQISAY